MTKITKEGLLENLKALSDFAYSRHHDDWLKFCEEKRNGKQDIEELQMLIVSITDENPWRVVLTPYKLKEMIDSLKKLFDLTVEEMEEVREKMESNQKLVSGDE